MKDKTSKTDAAVDMKRLVATRYQFKTDFNNMNIAPVTFDRMRSPAYEGEKWAVRRHSMCLSKKCEWEYEPIPSGRDDVFYARCRFDSMVEALEAFERASTEPHTTNR